jgi:uncharacterized protein (DUF433 family)
MMPEDRRYDLIGIGLYTVPEAARLTRVSRARIRRWLLGYAKTAHDERCAYPAVWQSELAPINGMVALSFADLMEVRFIDAFRRAGVSWRTIRLAAERATMLFNRNHPFSTQRFRSDGKSIFAELVRETGEKMLLELARSQFAFEQILSPSLYTGLDFSVHDEVVRWWPMPRRKGIVIDPQRSFGQPIVTKEGVPTLILKSAYDVEQDINTVADWFEVAPKSVKDAIAFERQLAA